VDLFDGHVQRGRQRRHDDAGAVLAGRAVHERGQRVRLRQRREHRGDRVRTAFGHEPVAAVGGVGAVLEVGHRRHPQFPHVRERRVLPYLARLHFPFRGHTKIDDRAQTQIGQHVGALGGQFVQCRAAQW
jgi:hypothetical protein